MTLRIFYVFLLLSHSILLLLAIVHVFLDFSFFTVAALAIISFTNVLTVNVLMSE